MLVESAGQQVMQQTSPNLPQFRNHRLHLRNRLVNSVEHRRNTELFIFR